VVTGPAADRPHMPGYGVLPAGKGSGLIPWAEAERRLIAAHDFWCATVTPGGAPHVMPVWGVWLEDQVWFSSSLRSRKARNLAADPRCTLTTDDAQNPVVVEGTARQVVDRPALERFVAAMNDKYDGGMTLEFLDPTVNGSYAVRPVRAFALTHDDFIGSPTRWTFPGG
jgi:PPOX class probable F420-dependent enzyme